jgi:hypothetical protein
VKKHTRALEPPTRHETGTEQGFEAKLLCTERAVVVRFPIIPCA